MKDREEFLASVYAKRDAELARKKKYKKRVISGLSAAAACLVLTVGLVHMDVVDFMDAAEGSFDGAAVDSITEKEAASNSSLEEVDDFTAEDSFREDGTEDQDTVIPGAVPGQEAPAQAAAQKDIYDLVTDENDSERAYYCLPRFTIELYEEKCASATQGGSIADVEKVQAWVDRLEENGQVFHIDGRLEDAAELKMDQVTCIVTIEREPQQKEIYYLTGEVGWYE